ncbi:subtilisin-like protease-like [Hibiscus syriacus]|uniref:Subtilisin-like protease-like n=2 Tax=Hibiscus syriacus TaxID=106335 RepID=A0A6A2ZWM1_HIBSY|nr:subtilisin-like protease-like [Hibiscus syriacus]
MVVKVSMNGDKSRSKALKIAVGLSGVESAALKGDDKSQIEVTGDGVDAVKLTSLLRKRVGHAELVSVADASGDKKEEKDETKSEQPPNYIPYYYQAVPSYGYVENYGPSCSIL